MEKQYQYLEPDEFKKELQKWIDKDVEAALCTYRGHVKEIHCNKDDAFLLKRVMTGNAYASTFIDQKSMLRVIQDAAFFSTKFLTEWILKPKSSFSSRKEYNNLEISVPFDEEDGPVGRGFKNDLKEYESYRVRLIFYRDHESKFGFFLETGYIELDSQDIALTGKEYSRNEAFKLIKPLTVLEETAIKRNELSNMYRVSRLLSGSQVLNIAETIRGNKYKAQINDHGQLFLYKFDRNTENYIEITEDQLPPRFAAEIGACKETIKNIELSRTSFSSLAAAGETQGSNAAPKKDPPEIKKDPPAPNKGPQKSDPRKPQKRPRKPKKPKKDSPDIEH